MKLRPLQDKIHVRVDKADAMHGKIILPDAAQKKPQIGTVLAVGPGEVGKDGTLRTLTVKKGDRILFAAYAGHQVQGMDDDLFILEDDVLGVIE